MTACEDCLHSGMCKYEDMRCDVQGIMSEVVSFAPFAASLECAYFKRRNEPELTLPVFLQRAERSGVSSLEEVRT